MKTLKKWWVILGSAPAGFFIAGMMLSNGIVHAVSGSWWVLLDFALMVLCLHTANKQLTKYFVECLKLGRLHGLKEAVEIAEKPMAADDTAEAPADALGKD